MGRQRHFCEWRHLASPPSHRRPFIQSKDVRAVSNCIYGPCDYDKPVSPRYHDVWRAVRETYAALVTSDAWDGKDTVDVPKANKMLLDVSSFYPHVSSTTLIDCNRTSNSSRSRSFVAVVSESMLESQALFKIPLVMHFAMHSALSPRRIFTTLSFQPGLIICPLRGLCAFSPNACHSSPTLSSIRKVKGAWSAVEAYIMATLRRRKEEDPGAMTLDEQDLSGDILNRLVMAWASADKYVLSEQEVVCNFCVTFYVLRHG